VIVYTLAQEFSSGFIYQLVDYNVTYTKILTLISSVLISAIIYYVSSIVVKFMFGYQRRDYKQIVYDVCEYVGGTKKKKTLSDDFVDLLDKNVKVDNAALLMNVNGRYYINAEKGLASDYNNYSIEKNSLLVKWLLDNKRPLYKNELIEEFDNHLITRDEIVKLNKLRWEVEKLNLYLCIPIFVKEKMLGILGVGKPKGKLVFSKSDITLLKSIAEQFVIRKQRLNQIMIMKHEKEQQKTLMQELEKELFFTDRLKSMGTMAASILHEIKNPISSLKMCTGIMNDKKNDSKVWNYYGHIVDEEINRLELIVSSFLRYSKKNPEVESIINLEEFINKTVTLMAVRMREERIELMLDIEEGLEVVVDEQSLHQVFINMFLNAEQAFRAGQNDKTILIKASKNNEKIKIEIKDNGIGIKQSNLEKIFDPFYSTKNNGTGLGLAICSRIVSEMDGSLAVSSKNNEGTAFIITLPGVVVESSQVA
jgi:signal transduction histidine kinase